MITDRAIPLLSQRLRTGVRAGLSLLAGGLLAGQVAGANEEVVTGTVTLVDTNRHLVVVQQGKQATGCVLEDIPPELSVGEKVAIAGSVSTYCTAFPAYPDRPDGREILPSFEGPTDWAQYYFLARMRGYLQAPADGEYTFWVAADDEAELWLSPNADPAGRKKIASVPQMTQPREWDLYAQQKSAPVHLKAGEAYYIEALQRQWRGHNCLAVAWQGPGFNQTVIDGQNLSPAPAVSGVTNGIVREYWTNFFLTSLARLGAPAGQPATLNFGHPHLEILGSGEWPEPDNLSLGGAGRTERNFQWVEVAGEIIFASRTDGRLNLELTNEDGRISATVFNWGTNATAVLEHRQVRLRGVCEQVNTAAQGSVPGIVWVAGPAQMTLADLTDDYWRGVEPTPMSALVTANPNLAWGRQILVHATVVGQDASTGALQVQGDDTYWAYTSSDGITWNQVGVPVSLAMSNTVYAGLTVSAVATRPLTVGEFDQLGDLAKSNECVCIGTASQDSRVEPDHGSYRILAGSGHIDDVGDKCEFLFNRLQEEGEVVARLKSLQGTHVSDRAGVMFRQTLDTGAPEVSLLASPEGRITLQYRQQPDALTRIVSFVTGKPPVWLKLHRSRYRFTVYPQQRGPVPRHQSMEIIGALNWQGDSAVLTGAHLRPEPVPKMPGPTLKAALQYQGTLIRNLPSRPEEDLQYANHIFDIHGVVTFSGRVSKRNLVFLQDESGGVLIRVLPDMMAYGLVQAGQFVELEGAIKFTRDEPPFGARAASVLGAGQFPEPRDFPNPTQRAEAESQWVKAGGVVRSVQPDGTLMLMEKDGLVRVWVNGTPAEEMEHYVDALVQVRGVYTRQIKAEPLVLVPSLAQVQVTEAAPPDPFAIPALPVNRLSVAGADPQTMHRLKVTGVVTYQEGEVLYVQDNTGGVLVYMQHPNWVSVGDRVEVAGFPEQRGNTVVFTKAIVNKTGAGHLPVPVLLSLPDTLEGQYNASLVELEGILLEQKVRNGQQLMELQTGGRVFEAVLGPLAGTLASFPAGSLMQITGINRTSFAAADELSPGEPANPLPSTFEVLLRSPADAVLLQRPPWWDWRYTAGVGVLGVLVLTASFVWIRTLRRRVEERTSALKLTMSQLQKETENSATLAERDRLAGEIHDSLEQGLSGIMMQLDGVDSKLGEDAGGARHYLEMARRMVRFSRSEVRHSLWNLESELLANRDLGAALTEVARQMSTSDQVGVLVEVAGTACPLPPATEHHLLRICQEALNNALKHAAAKTIRIGLNYAEKSVQLTVADDGRGFAPETVLTGTGKHLGLRNLRSRARKMKGRLEVVSRPDQGTRIEVTVPVNPAPEGPGNEANQD